MSPVGLDGRVHVLNFIYKVVLGETPLRKVITFIAPNRNTKETPWQMAVTADEALATLREAGQVIVHRRQPTA